MLPLCTNNMTYSDPGHAEDVEDVSMCSPDKHLRKRKASTPPILPIISESSPEDSSTPAPKIQRPSHNLLVLNDLELIQARGSASAGLIGEIGTDSELRHQLHYISLEPCVIIYARPGATSSGYSIS